MHPKRLLLVGAAVLLGLSPATGHAQTPDDGAEVYRREIFRYSRAGRPDPFRSLLQNTEMGMRIEDLTLRGVVHHPDPDRSVAILRRRGTERHIRAKVGDRIGGVRIVAIRPRGVDVLIEEFGVARRASLELKTDAKKGEIS